MKKIILMISAVSFILMACNDGETSEMEEMYEAFNRNHEELRNDVERELDAVRNAEDREEQLDIYYNNLIPKFDDFKAVINNFEFGSTENLELQESMLDYIDSLEELTRMYGQFNLNFHVANPMDDEDFSTSFEEELDAIRALEVETDEKYEAVEAQYNALVEE
ncbi:hypothetical protein [Salinicoccus kekensis]|uniref:Cell-wall binding lipoprotein n=1 Tax=Salinicoccus kekensis TaxID=714307 RepID=A0A285UBR9_9STAP|nr:hypothetical protein [Salinicoccus kekensis]SOC39259.1 hypothetical protein SAMN05878391_0796 [Salinicoccus kekensis]